MLELRHLRAYIVVAEELHFGRAAERLHITQPPLTQLIKQLESHVGVVLLQRSTRFVSLTPAGAVFLSYARSIIDTVGRVVRDTQRAELGECGKLVIGFTSSTAYQFLPRMISLYRSQYPDVALDYFEMRSRDLEAALKRRLIDVALLRLPPINDESLCHAVVQREYFTVAMPASHPLASRRTIATKDLHDLPFIGFSYTDSPYFSAKLDQFFAVHDVKPRVIQRAALHTILAYVEAGVGVALMPESVGRQQVPGVRFIPLDARQRRQHCIELTAAWRREEESAIITQWLCAVQGMGRGSGAKARR